ncbi:L,D-transpeptidase [Lichenicola sp.]|uniref:L,D-transpeptidase n=1 Tax=Lichenicola sp. TaxID=2804529 RepID=UPI003B00745C
MARCCFGIHRSRLQFLVLQAGLIGVAVPAAASSQALSSPLPLAVAGTAASSPLPPPPPPPPILSAAETVDAARLLTLQMHLAVGHSLARVDPEVQAASFRLAARLLERSGQAIDRPQTLLLVDRSPAVQRLWVILALPGAAPWQVIGAVRVSTGKPGRLEHFKTPVGVFTNTPSILGYRAQGTFNEHHIRGNGLKGMRVWDLGWQTTEDWRKPAALTAVRLEMHATDPTFLEARLGRPDSEACIRIPAAFNQFLDRSGLIDMQLVQLASQDRAIAALLPKDRATTRLAGDKVIVIDSSEPDAAPSDPGEATAINQRFAEWLAAQALPPAVQKQPAVLASRSQATAVVRVSAPVKLSSMKPPGAAPRTVAAGLAPGGRLDTRQADNAEGLP